MQADVLELLRQNGCLCAAGGQLSMPFEYEPPVRLYHGVGSNCSFGAFSYAASRLSHFRLGRYCSVAHGVEVLSDHPTDWLSSHTFSYWDIFEGQWLAQPQPEGAIVPPPASSSLRALEASHLGSRRLDWCRREISRWCDRGNRGHRGRGVGGHQRRSPVRDCWGRTRQADTLALSRGRTGATPRISMVALQRHRAEFGLCQPDARAGSAGAADGQRSLAALRARVEALDLKTISLK